MKIIVPMAGIGKRMRPHTLTIPKPLINIAGKPIVQRLVEGIISVCDETIDEINFIIGDFGKDVEDILLNIAKNLNVKGKISYQHDALGTAHAILCAEESLKGNIIVAFADTLFNANFNLDTSKDGIIWTHKVEDPSSFGVVKTNEKNIITDFVEKPQKFVSNQAIIGIYYFNNSEYLKNELQYLIDNKIIKDGEYLLTDALQNMMNKGVDFTTQSVDEWLDCGNKDATVYTNQRILETNKIEPLISDSVKLFSSIINKPCFIGKNVEIKNSIIGPHVSIENNSKIEDSIITNSIVQTNTLIKNANIDNSMIGNHVTYKGKVSNVSIGDYTTMF